MIDTTRLRRALADRLIAAGYRLDPDRPTVRMEGNGVVIGFSGVPLAKVNLTPGDIVTNRPPPTREH